jgi:hypothetical protein
MLTNILIRKVPETIRRKFKEACARDGVSMQSRIIWFMNTYNEDIQTKPKSRKVKP